MGGRKKKRERTKNPKERGAGGVGSFRICNDSVCHWWAFGTGLIVGQTVEIQGACVWALHHHCAVLSKSVRSQLTEGTELKGSLFHLM